MSTALVWLRRDLRLADNPALHAAARGHARVLPVYIDEPPAEHGGWVPGAATRWWLHHALLALQEQLRQCGSGLHIARGPALVQLRALAAATGAQAVYWNRLYEPALIVRDRRVAAGLRADGLQIMQCNAALLAEPWELQTAAGSPYRVFTPFWRALQARPWREPLPAPEQLPALPRPAVPESRAVEELKLLPAKPWDQGFYAAWRPGEAGAWAELERFCAEAAQAYGEQRDIPAAAATSRLSPHLHFGEIGPAQIAARLRRLAVEQPDAQAGTAQYLRQLGWREFAHHLLHHFPHTPEQPLDPRFARLRWRCAGDYAADLRAWQRGRTGIPIVDAGMRELWSTGWMHNRVRMLAASLLTKNLLVPWQEGARWFWDTLVDADLANNTLGWQWTAGCGADAAPYFRVFNPVLQAERFDPAGAYLRRWLPELVRVPDSALRAPWRAPPAVLAAAGVRLGLDYPLPIVDLAASRNAALAAYASLRAGAD